MKANWPKLYTLPTYCVVRAVIGTVWEMRLVRGQSSVNRSNQRTSYELRRCDNLSYDCRKSALISN